LSWFCSVVRATPYFFVAFRIDLNWLNLKACSASSNLAFFERILGRGGGAIVICGYFKKNWGKVAGFGDVAGIGDKIRYSKSPHQPLNTVEL
jgi:hypothetical protein